MTKKETILSIIDDFREEYKNDSQVTGAYDRGLAKDEDKINILLRMIKARKGTTKMVNLCAKHNLYIPESSDIVYLLDFQDHDGNELSKQALAERKDNSEENKESATQLLSVEKAIKLSFMIKISKAFENDSMMVKTLQVGEDKGETLNDLIIRVIKCRKNSSRTIKIAEQHGMEIRFDENDYLMNFDANILESIIKPKDAITSSAATEIKKYLKMIAVKKVDKAPISEIERAINLREKYFSSKHKK